MSVYQEKAQQVAGILDELGIDVWLIFVRETAEHTDPVLKVLGQLNAVWPAAFLYHRSGARVAITGQGDDEAVRAQGLFDEVIPYQLSIKEPLLAVLDRWQPQSIGVNYSQSDVSADGLTYGMYLNLKDYLAGTPYVDRLVSAADVCEAVRSRKTAAEVEAMRKAGLTALGIFEGMASWLKCGMSEKEISARVRRQVAELGLETAWEPDHCPGLNAGPNSPWGHAGPSDEVIRPGITLNMDFGVKQDGFCSDNQRVWYFLREGETEAPAGVKHAFESVRDGIQAAFDAVKPGMQGWEVDDVARRFIVNAGYEEFPHALGHQVGRYAHDGGVGFYPRWERYGTKPYDRVAAGQVFTLEFGVRTEWGYISIEEMIILREHGAEWLVPPQKELWLVKL
ncbi:MAG: Xaa-Pro peptidase family protein [Anaerolineales bacterium]